MSFNPNQPRDPNGKWTGFGGSSSQRTVLKGMIGDNMQAKIMRSPRTGKRAPSAAFKKETSKFILTAYHERAKRAERATNHWESPKEQKVLG